MDSKLLYSSPKNSTVFDNSISSIFSLSFDIKEYFLIKGKASLPIKKMIKIIERTIKKPPSLKTYSAALSFIFLLLNAVFSFKLKFFLSFTA